MKKNIGKIIGIIFFTFVILFTISRFGRFLRGPVIIESSLNSVQEIETSHIVFKGTVKNVDEMMIEGRPIVLSDGNRFEETIVVPPGETIIQVDVYDVFNKHRQYIYDIVSVYSIPEYPLTYQKALEGISLPEENNSETPPLQDAEEIINTQ